MASPRLKLSLCYMVKNEAEFLSASLNSIIDHVEEAWIYDTGSTDNTKEIAQRFQSRCPHFHLESMLWTDHFSEMRNQIAKHCTQPWILFVDGDEVLDGDAISKIAQAIENQAIASYSLIQRNYTWNPQTEGAKLVNQWPPSLPTSSKSLYYFENWMERLYRPFWPPSGTPSKKIEFEGRIHESLLPSIRRQNLQHEKLDIVLHHFGRLKAQHEKKIEYYLKLTEQKCKEDPLNPAAWVEWMITLSEANDFQRALQIASGSVKKFANEPEILRSAFQIALRANAFAWAEDWLKQYLQMKPDDLESKAHLTTAYLYQRKFNEAVQVSHEILKLNSKNFVCHVNLAVIHFEREEWSDAERHLLAALEQKPTDGFLNEAIAKVRSKIQRH